MEAKPLFRANCIGLALLCASLLPADPAEAQTLFSDATAEIGVPLTGVRSLAFGDYDNDGRPDLLMPENFSMGRVSLLRNQGGGEFLYQTHRIRGDVAQTFKGGGAGFGDYDNDGDLDAYVPVGTFFADSKIPNLLLRNDRGRFSEVAEEVGLTDALPSDNAIWLDYDRDGNLDLYVGNLGAPNLLNKLYRGNGDGTFSDVSEEAGLGEALNPDAGGTNGGMVAGDLNGDGWSDLYLGIYLAPNRLFLNDGKGIFVDATSGDIPHLGEAFGVAAGDIDNDGDLDLFLAANGGSRQERSTLLLNLGEGEFLDVTEAVGLGAFADQAFSGGCFSLADIDNDGDLDLLSGMSPDVRLFANDGGGVFTNASAQAGIPGGGIFALGDFDLDGFLDVAGGGWGGSSLYRNNGNGNHWLIVEPVGRESNRTGIGARVIATSGELTQVREVFGGVGYSQDEMIAHFGLGGRMQVDRLEIRWPSGQVDAIEEIPADRRIRVIEGSGSYHAVVPTEWEHDLPASATAGDRMELKIAVRPALFEETARVVGVRLDLGQLGGGEAVALEEAGEGTYRLQTAIEVGPVSGRRDVTATVEQETSLGIRWTQLVETVVVEPAAKAEEDLILFADGVAEGWNLRADDDIPLDLGEEDVVYEGAAAISVPASGRWSWEFSFAPDEPVQARAYEAIRFAFRKGATGSGWPIFFLAVNSNQKSVGLLEGTGLINLPGIGLEEIGASLDEEEWQVVEVPLDAFFLEGPIEAIRLVGNLSGTFYLDDIRLVAGRDAANTAVVEERMNGQPRGFALEQNFPNPFNSGTAIRFALPVTGDVELSIYNLAGQKVATLVEGMRAAGIYEVKWDGKDARGRSLASGVYLYRLQAGGRVSSRALVLLK